MAENRTGVHILANRAGLSYADTKQLLFEIMVDTPRAASAARTLAIAIGGDRHEKPREHQ
ncbi:hypothetical protein GHK68_28620 [Sinorhizobium meliloti]|uniref:hypothetical protein n=1 Tax=Rhizobium meliloti TaxID=382 RepID=UPI001297641A|nr:hypothetical protein [Sinorhizobium meliloti]MQW46122.1 hypothetical protein [Sinorhizobium meliloti]